MASEFRTDPAFGQQPERTREFVGQEAWPPETVHEELTRADSRAQIDLASLSGYLSHRAGEQRIAESATIVAGGKSNLTYAVTVSGVRWILRRPPLGHVLETAHDMTREFRVLEALARATSLAPRPWLMCQNADVIGAPFYLMEMRDGISIRDPQTLEKFGRDGVASISTQLVHTLAELHSLDHRSIGLGDFGHPEGFVARQIRRWMRQYSSSALTPDPRAGELRTRLQNRVPATSRTALVHGDFKLDNVLVTADARIETVLDWEMATIGDPCTDLGLLIAYREIAGTAIGGFLNAAGAVEGYISAARTADLYFTELPARGDIDLDFYVALGYFKLAGVIQGIARRHDRGETVGDGFAGLGSAVAPLLQLGLERI